MIDPAALAAYLQIIAINVVLSGDNVVVIGMAVASLGPELRGKAIMAGITAATIIRIVFALLATQLLTITGLLLAGGILLLWVCWKMFEELRHSAAEEAASAGAGDAAGKTLGQAITQIVIADVSMSLDNVLAVAGAAKQNWPALVFGLTLSVLLMGVAAGVVAKLMNRFRWISWAGLIIIAYVSVTMIYEGLDQLIGHTLPAIPLLKG